MRIKTKRLERFRDRFVRDGYANVRRFLANLTLLRACILIYTSLSHKRYRLAKECRTERNNLDAVQRKRIFHLSDTVRYINTR